VVGDAGERPERTSILDAKRECFVCSASFYLECDARPPAGAVEEPVSALEGGNLLRQAGRKSYRSERACLRLGDALGTA